MTMKRLSEAAGALATIRDETALYSSEEVPKPSPQLIEVWCSLPESVRSSLVSFELSRPFSSLPAFTSTTVSDSSDSPTPYVNESSKSHSSTISDELLTEFNEKCLITNAEMKLRPLERAPRNVFSFTKESVAETTFVENKSAMTVTTTTKIVTSSRGWRNIFTLPISYDVNLVQQGTIFDSQNPQLFQSTGVHIEGYNRRFAVIDAEVDRIYGVQFRNYFSFRGIELTTCILNGGEADKRPKAVDELLDSLCAYKLRRREPFLAIGGGVVLDIAGMAACLYRRGVPFVRVPTTLLSIVDASVGVKNGVDYCCGITDETYKNRIGSFYTPSSCLLDTSFIMSQDQRHVSNGFGEILKLALVRSPDLFELLEAHGEALIKSRFAPNSSTPPRVAQRIIDLSIQIMLEELGPNLWEERLDRCVDYGHTFSKLLEMVPGSDLLHGEAVNVDGFFCVILSYTRGYIDVSTVLRVLNCMKSLSLPTSSKDLTEQLAWQSCKDAIEHRNGEQRIPLITGIGESICISDITQDELKRALNLMEHFNTDDN